MSLRDVPRDELVPNVTRLRCHGGAPDSTYVRSDDQYVWVKEDGDDCVYGLLLDDVEVIR